MPTDPASAAAEVIELDWLGACRQMVERQRELFDETAGIAARTVYEGVGEGGDRALAIDRRCEDIVFDELERLRQPEVGFLAISEERGEVAFGEGGAARVVIDPIDGSLNARRTLPAHALSVAIASGPAMADVEVAYVFDFGPGEEFFARRGRGAELDGAPLRAEGPGYGLEVVGIESAKPDRILPLIESLAGKAFRIRAIGSIAISVCNVAAGRFDAMLTARECRSVDAAAAQLVAREAGAAVAFGSLDASGAALALDARYHVAAALDPGLLDTILDVQGHAKPASPR
jgi:myo-inositol-1(or 4)-monophosphatase